ncbi:MAG: ferric reductase-like transmembrane domain-containing protein [Rhizobiaceae bacterium]
MAALKTILNSRIFIWALLALPSIPMTLAITSGNADLEGLLHPTGEFAARFMIIAMIITPFRLMFPKAKFWMWMMRRRRNFGVAAFAYAALHTVLYIVDMNSLQAMLDEFLALGIWTGWVAFAIFIPLAVTSNDTSQRLMLSWWKPLQRWVYPAAVLTLLHWMFVHNDFGPALVHFVPLALLEVYRVWKTSANHKSQPANA